METTLESIRVSFESFVKTTDEKLGQIRGEIIENTDEDTSKLPTPALDLRNELKTQWRAIRDDLERRAADTDVDGRTRGRYWRMDRRVPLDLVNALANDRKLGNISESYRQAVDLWQRFRSGRAAPAREDVDRMTALRKAIVPN
jgi:hypothetical protein